MEGLQINSPLAISALPFWSLKCRKTTKLTCLRPRRGVYGRLGSHLLNCSLLVHSITKVKPKDDDDIDENLEQVQYAYNMGYRQASAHEKQSQHY